MIAIRCVGCLQVVLFSNAFSLCMYRGFVIPMGSGMNMAAACEPLRSRACHGGLSACIALHLAR